MSPKCTQFIDYITTLSPAHNKQVVMNSAQAEFNLTKDRKVYYCDAFAVRFCYSKYKSESFGNTVLSLSALRHYDHLPFFVVLVRQSAPNMVLLANTTFLKKISHSSQQLAMNNIRGSFNGSDIMRHYDELANTPDKFSQLFAIHQGFDSNDNLQRLVDASAMIKPHSQKFCPTDEQQRHLFDSIKRASIFVQSANFLHLKADLDQRCKRCKNEISVAAHIENTNIRGRLIESLITADEEQRAKIIGNLKDMEKALPVYDTKNGLGDYFAKYDNGDTYTDIKTKVVYLNSNPKAYNVDNFLQQMADEHSVFLFYFIGIDENGVFQTLLSSVYHGQLMTHTRLQQHWAGRSTRGVAQFDGKAIDEMLNAKDFKNQIDYDKSEQFLKDLLNR